MTATTASRQSGISSAEPGFGSTLASEWTKLRSVRSTWIILLLGLVLSIGFSALMAFVTGLTWDEWSDADRAAFDPVLYSVNGILFTLILLIVLGVTAVTAEYRSRMIRTTFIVTPRRLRVMVAKTILIAILGLVLSVVSFLGMFLASQPIYDAYGLATASLADSDALRMLAYTPVTALIYTMIPLSIAFLLRGTASAITAAIGFFFAPWILSALLPTWFQENVLRYLPDMAADSLAGITSSDSAMYLSQGPAIVTVTAWLVVSLGAAAFVLNRRDA